MNIILVGCGKVGDALAHKLTREGHNLTVIDTNAEKIQNMTEKLDIMGVLGNGSSIAVLEEAGLEEADVFIAVTGSDELNLLCCMFAKKAGQCRAVARVRNPLYSKELEFIRQQLGISTIINPELATAREISRLLRFPAANKIDTFADGKVRLIKFKLEDAHGVDEMPLKDIPGRMGCDVLICAVERGHEVIIPDGEFILKNEDMVTVLATQEKANEFFKKLGLPITPAKNAMIVGGGDIGFYLAKELLHHHIQVRMIEKDIKRCEELAELLPEATVLHGDATDRQFLLTEGLQMADAFVSLTDLDEENIMLAMFAKKQGVLTTATKINRLEFDDIIEELDIGSVVYPKYIICDFIVQHIRALQNESGSNVKTLYQILDDRVEALEFTVHQESKVTNVPLAELSLKPNQLICCITRGEQVIIPRGSDTIQVGDTVIVVTLAQGLQDLTDILAD
ncbi:MAG: Trk system potassium transporter TrkA [Clostridia bacterium]|nr:Trk system potassium transporter TrkA [Clostridia bacterium]